MPLRLSINTSDFGKIRRMGFRFVDKSRFVAEVVESPVETMLLCRPRRFGKTINMSMLQYFLEASTEDHSALFSDLSVWGNVTARAHFQRHPVIALSFKDAKAMKEGDTLDMICAAIRSECQRHRDILPSLLAEEVGQFEALLDGTASTADYALALRTLSGWLQRHHGAPVVLLIDEYDAPILTGHQYGFYDAMVSFSRSFFGAGFKDNPALYKGVLTGVLQVAKEGLFSGLNQLRTWHMLSNPSAFDDAFGFTEAEVEMLRKEHAPGTSMQTLRDWYNGYRIGDTTLYNPWSIVNTLSEGGEPGPWWVGTGELSALTGWILSGAEALLANMEGWIRGEERTVEVPDRVTLRQISAPEVTAILVQGGYLCATATRERHGDAWRASLKAPNHEVKMALEDVARRWLLNQANGDAPVDMLLRAFLRGDVEEVEGRLGRLVQNALSVHDIGSPATTPEVVYHAFILGMLVRLEPTHRVRSNPESGFGRADVLVVPRVRGQAGAVIEFKLCKEGQTLAQGVEVALKQLQRQNYVAELQDAGATPIYQWGIAFAGKRIAVGLLDAAGGPVQAG